MPEKKPQSIPFQQVIAALLDHEHPLPASYFHRFSDLDKKNVEELKRVWPRISDERRLRLLEDLEELAETDTLVNFDALSRMALNDTDPRVRVMATRLLWECEEASLIPIFIRQMTEDSDEIVRAASATALGLFVYLGELEEISPKQLEQVENALLDVLKGSDQPIVRRRALESLGFSSRPEVIGLIENAYKRGEAEWEASALFAMGRSANERWEKAVMASLKDEVDDVRLEAIRAAGLLGLEAAHPTLIEMIKEITVLDEMQMAAVWSLTQIGGRDVRDRLEDLHEAMVEEGDADFIEQALENLEFTEDMASLGMFDFGLDEEEEDSLILDDELPDDEKPEDANGSKKSAKDQKGNKKHRS